MEYILAKKLVHKVDNGQHWFGVTHNANIYRGCDHGCIYCDSRSSCYQIANFDKIRAKENAEYMIDQELSNKRKSGILSLGGMNDPYNHIERELEYTRNALKSADKAQFGIVIHTKSDLVLRDIDILHNISLHSSVNVGITITTADDRLQNRIERNVSSSSERFRAIKELSSCGIYCGILMMPLLPFINDTLENVTNIVLKAHESGANYILPSFGVTLRDNQRQHFFNKIGPEITKMYVDMFGDAYVCTSPKQKELKQRFEELCEKYGIVYKMIDIINGANKKVVNKQLTLF